MKLPELPLSGQARALRTGDVEKARRREQDVSIALRGAANIGSKLTQQAVRIAENEARLQAANEITAMQERVNTQRRELTNTYLSDDAPPVEQYLDDDTALIRDAAAETRKKLSPRAQRYANDALMQAEGPGYQESRFKTFTELAANRQRLHLVDVTARADRQIREDPNLAPQYLANASALFDDLYYENDQQRDALEREFMTNIVGTTIESYNANGRPEDTLALLTDERYSQYVKDPEESRKLATNMTLDLLSQRIDYAIDAVALDPDRGDVLRDDAPITVSSTENIVGFDQDQAVRDLRNRVANVQLQSYVNRNRAEEALTRLNNGDFNRDLSGEEIGDWLNKLNTAIAAGTESRVALDLHRADRLITGIKNGDPAAVTAGPVVQQELRDRLATPGLTKAQEISVREKLFEVETYAANPQFFGSAPTQMSRAELDANIAGAESLLITPEGGDFETAAKRDSVVNAAVKRMEGLKTEFDSDPAAYLLKYNPDVRENWRNLTTAMMNIDDPAQAAALPQYMARHMDAMTSKQTQDWGVADADVEYFPENMPLVKNIMRDMEGLDINAKAQRVVFLSSAVPQTAMPSFLKQIKAEDPGLAAAVNFTSEGLYAEAENQLLGAQRRTAINAAEGGVTKDKAVVDGLRFLGGIPYDALPAGADTMYTEILLNEYYAIATEEELNAGTPSQDTLQRAQKNVWGEIVDIPQSLLPNNRMLSYRRADNKVMATASQVQAQLSAIRDNRVELTSQPKTAFGGSVSQADLITKGKFIPVGNGKYQVVLPESRMVGARLMDGFVLDENNQPYILDLNAYPLTTPPESLIPRDFESAF